jgi:hypothetical protein
MAIIENPKIGRARNSIGNVTLSTHWGRNVMRTKPINVNDPKTPAQLACRGRFKKVRDLVCPMLKYINPAYADSITDMAPYNRVVSINMKHCFIGDTDEIDPNKFVLCENDGSFVDNVVLTSTVADTITGTFDSNPQNAEEDGDPVKAYGIDISGNIIWKFDQEAQRSTGTITLTRPEMSSLNIAVYFECLDSVNLLNGMPKHVIKYVGTVAVSGQ